MERKRIFAAAAMLLVTAVSFSGCGSAFSGLEKLASGLEGIVAELENVSEDWNKYEAAREKLTNYRIAITAVDEGGNISNMTELKTETGYAMVIDQSITYIEYGSGVMYQLNSADKIGVSVKLESDDTYKGFGAIASLHLFGFEMYRLLGAKKTGSEKVAGREANIYEYEMQEYAYKFWIDAEYGLTLKSVMASGGETKTMEVKEFKVGGVSLGDVVKLSEYEIQDLANLAGSVN